MVRVRRGSRLRRGVQEKLIKYFCGGVTARAAAETSGVIPRQHFHLFIKECEWRFNYRPIGRMQATLMEWWFK
jgi:transposase-like protein